LRGELALEPLEYLRAQSNSALARGRGDLESDILTPSVVIDLRENDHVGLAVVVQKPETVLEAANGFTPPDIDLLELRRRDLNRTPPLFGKFGVTHRVVPATGLKADEVLRHTPLSEQPVQGPLQIRLLPDGKGP
jgi:hypothetical protein